MNLKWAASVPCVALLLLPVAASSQLRNDPDRDCDQCKDLCYLVDQYWQKERGIQVWKRYAAETPERHRIPIPARVTNFDDFEKMIYEEKLPNAERNRTFPCELAQDWERPIGSGPQGEWKTGLQTQPFKGPSCKIVFGTDEVKGDVEKKWRSTHQCKGSADAEYAHELVHQEHCKAVWKKNNNDQLKSIGELSDYSVYAQSELQAWRRHRNRLRDQIQGLALKCGWQPTEGQKKDPSSVPTEYQTKQMEIGWKAFNALNGTPP